MTDTEMCLFNIEVAQAQFCLSVSIELFFFPPNWDIDKSEKDTLWNEKV